MGVRHGHGHALLDVKLIDRYRAFVHHLTPVLAVPRRRHVHWQGHISTTFIPQTSFFYYPYTILAAAPRV